MQAAYLLFCSNKQRNDKLSARRFARYMHMLFKSFVIPIITGVIISLEGTRREYMRDFN